MLLFLVYSPFIKHVLRDPESFHWQRISSIIIAAYNIYSSFIIDCGLVLLAVNFKHN